MWGIIGNEFEVGLLHSSIIAGRWAHAYLIVGPEFSGKRILAKQLAKALNCLSNEKPCDVCSQCLRISDDKQVDVITLDIQKEAQSAIEDSNQLAILRDIVRFLGLTPVEGAVRVVILENADRISIEAQNSCLKLLEEPPQDVVLILLATHPQSLLRTLKSRCQLLNLGPVSFQSMMSYLVDVKQLSAESAVVIAGSARGLTRLADFLISNDDWWGELDSKFVQFVELLDASIPERLRMIPLLEQGSGRSKDEIIQVLRLWMVWYRDMLMIEYGLIDGVLHSQFKDKMEELTLRLPPTVLADCIHRVNATIRNIKMNANMRLSLERLVLEL